MVPKESAKCQSSRSYIFRVLRWDNNRSRESEAKERWIYPIISAMKAMVATKRSLLLLMIGLLLVTYEVIHWRHSAMKVLTDSLKGNGMLKRIRSVST